MGVGTLGVTFAASMVGAEVAPGDGGVRVGVSNTTAGLADLPQPAIMSNPIPMPKRIVVNDGLSEYNIILTMQCSNCVS